MSEPKWAWKRISDDEVIQSLVADSKDALLQQSGFQQPTGTETVSGHEAVRVIWFDQRWVEKRLVDGMINHGKIDVEKELKEVADES